MKGKARGERERERRLFPLTANTGPHGQHWTINTTRGIERERERSGRKGERNKNSKIKVKREIKKKYTGCKKGKETDRECV